MDDKTLLLTELFENANREFMRDDFELFETKVSERTLCGALKQHLDSHILETEFKDYNIDIEYNRNYNGRIKTCSVLDNGQHIITSITCDLIVHSRGKNIKQDNLIAVEMKKAYRPKKEKDNDRRRLIALTKDSYDDVWSADGKTLPEHVCGYKLGVYYEINYVLNLVLIEYYIKGKCEKTYEIDLKNISV